MSLSEVKPRSGRPTKAAALERDERLLVIAADMFMAHGFEGTSMERLAEAAMIGKATLYARYSDKGALFAAVLRRKIVLVYGPLEAEVAEDLTGKSLEDTLHAVGHRLIHLLLTPSAQALGRILAAQGLRFPELGRLAVEEGMGRQVRLVATILRHFSPSHRYRLDDLSLLAEVYLGLILGRTSRMALLGVSIETETLDQRVRLAVEIFLHGAVMPPD